MAIDIKECSSRELYRKKANSYYKTHNFYASTNPNYSNNAKHIKTPTVMSDTRGNSTKGIPRALVVETSQLNRGDRQITPPSKTKQVKKASIDA